MHIMRQSPLLLVVLGAVSLASLEVNPQVVTATLPSEAFPASIAANAVTNKIYVANNCGNDPNCQSMGTVTVIDGVTLATQSINVGGYYPYGVAVNSVTNKIYVANCGGDPSCASN